MKTQIFIDLVNSQILITRVFAQKAKQIGSPEFIQLAEMRQRHPNCAVVQRTIQKKEGKRTYSGFTYDKMREHLDAWYGANSNERMELEGIIKYAQTSAKEPYPYVKHWFLENHSATLDYDKMTCC